MTEKEMRRKEQELLSSLLEKSEDRKIVEAYLTESVIRGMQSLPVGESLLLMNDPMPQVVDGIPKISRGMDRLIYVELESDRIRERDGFVAGQACDLHFRGEVARRIADYLMDLGFRTEIPEEGEVIRLQPTLRDIRLRMEIELRGVKRDDLYPVKRKITGLLDGEELEYQHYPVEEEVAEHMDQILKKLELISDMREYLSLYEILQEEPLEGRRVQDIFRGLWNRPYREKTREFFLSYGDYPYMAKKWKKLEKQEPNLPEWKKVHEVIGAFLLPIWDAEAENRIFLDSWMPGLGRYL